MAPNPPPLSAAPAVTESDPLLTTTPPTGAGDHDPFHLSLNPTAPTTIVLLHGLLSSHIEWAYVTPHLQSYHVLLVDLPGHSRSSHLPRPFTIAAQADSVAALIRSQAHGGAAHVVGLSMGGFVALDLARRHASVVRTVFATGAAPFDAAVAALARWPSVMYHLFGLPEWMPSWLYDRMVGWMGMLPHAELRAEMVRNRRPEVVRDVYGSILGIGEAEIRAVKVRTVAIAAGLQDQVPAVARMGPWLRAGGGDAGSMSAVVRKAVHAWDLQFPELFAQGVVAWVEGKELPAEFEKL